MDNKSSPSGSDLALIAAISALWTACIITFSTRVGRLAHHSAYDDCTYLFDAWWRVDLLDREGLGAALHTLTFAFPHSPWNTLQSFVAFQLFGLNDVGPYVFHVLLVFTLLLTVAWIFRDLPRWIRVVAILLALSFQFTFFVVHELRPDPAYAILLGTTLSWGIIATWQKRNLDRSLLMRVFALLALSLYFKPTFFLNSIFIAGVFGASLLIASVTVFQKDTYSRTIEPLRQRLSIALKALILPAVAFIVVSLPLFIFRFDYFLDYLLRNAFGSETNIWKIEGGMLAAAHFFTVGWGGSQMLGKSFFTALFLLGIAILVLLVRRRFDRLIPVAWMLIMTAAALFVMASGQLNTPFFGLTFHVLLVISSIFASSQAIAGLTAKPLLLFGVVFITAALRNTATFTPSWELDYPIFHQNQRVFSISHKEHGIVGPIIDQLEIEINRQNGVHHKGHIFVSFVGSINKATLVWAAALRGFDWDFQGFDRNESLDDYAAAIADAQLVLTAEVDAPEISLYLPTANLHPQVHDLVRQHPDFTLVAEFPTYSGASYFLFKRR